MSVLPPGIPPDAEEVSLGGFNKFVGPLFRLAAAEDGALQRYAFVVADKHMNAAGSTHGGMLMAFMDVAMAQSTRRATGARGANTVSLTCDFVGPGRLGDVIEAQVRITRRTRTMVFLSGELSSAGRKILVGTGLWKVVAEA